MSASASTTGESAPPSKKRSLRGTTQSGFSLLARGEPKIWLTGGMLVICLAMILGLLSMIAAKGLSTFWPGRVDWLVLKSGQLEIGEPQGTEQRDAVAEPSSFYRTANFEITNRHYRWLEPTELDATGIVQPEWALVLERVSWGRMYALPSRLMIPLASEEPPVLLQGLAETDALLKEISTELEALESSSIQPTPNELAEAVRIRLAGTLSDHIKNSIKLRINGSQENILVQHAGRPDWVPLDRSTDLTNATLAAARIAWSQPEQIVSQSGPVIDLLTENRLAVKRLMQAISALDKLISEARVRVRQAEIESSIPLLSKVDSVTPLVERLATIERNSQRIDRIRQRASTDFQDENLARRWRDLLASYRENVLEPQLTAIRSELDIWSAQFAEMPPFVQSAVGDFQNAWHGVLSRKQPMESELQQLRSRNDGYELTVLVPTDAVTISLSEADTAQLKKGHWTGEALASLAGQNASPQDSSTRVRQHNSEITEIEFEDLSRGRLSLWSGGKDWVMPAQRAINCDEIVRMFPANRLSVPGKFRVYAARWREFLLDEPREANTEGGIFPAIWGTVVMTLIMTLAVVPFGVIAALYLREYTRSGPLVSLVRISINNLAGVPSIVYGVFGLAFFCYSIGAFIDGGARNADFGTLPSGSWYLLLGTTTLVGVIAFMSSMFASGSAHTRPPLALWVARLAPLLWILSLIGVGILIFKSPFFHGFYEARLPDPSFGKGGLLWASLTLSLLTLPVVIVATEEALAAVPNSLREGSLACGASKWQTIKRIVLPHARPGILTGAILAMARGIGEVAPLMLVGALPVAPDLPLDSEFPYFHGSRSFMHLGYQIYWLGFQSQNSEASKPLVFTCTLVLILIVVALNLSAILLRAQLRKRFQGNQF